MNGDQKMVEFDLRNPSNVGLCTEAYYRFLRRHSEIFDHMFFANSLATHADEARAKAVKALYPEDHPSRKKLADDPQPAFERLLAFGEYRSEVIAVFSVDNFLCYLSEIIQSAARKKPTVLKSNSKISVEDALRFSSRRELVDFIINSKINELSYGGLFSIEEFLESRTNTRFPDDLVIRSRLNFAVELRNVYVHSRGIINELFVSRLKHNEHGFQVDIGKRFHANFDILCKLANSLFDTAAHVDQELAGKFSIARKRYSTWDKSRTEQLKHHIETLRKKAKNS